MGLLRDARSVDYSSSRLHRRGVKGVGFKAPAGFRLKL